MATVNRWAIIEDNKVVNVIIADEEFITSQGFDAVQDDLATVGLNVDEDGNIIYPEVILLQPDLMPSVEEVSEDIPEE
jgi:hypothetical protein